MRFSTFASLTGMALRRFVCLFAMVFIAMGVKAQYVNIPVTGFNNDLVANGTGATNTATTGTMPGVTNPAIGCDGVGYTFIDATYKWHSGSTLPTCFLPTGGAIPSTLTPGLTYQMQNYTSFNALSIASNTYTGSVLPTSGTISLSTPASYGVLKVLYETVQNTAGPTITATITFTDATTQVISGISFVNWFTNTGTTYSNISRAQNVAPGAPGACATGPYLFEMSLNILPANYGKQVASVSFNFSAATGAAANTVNYLHVLALGGIAPCVGPVDQPTALSLSSPTGTTATGSFTAAASLPSGYLVVGYPSGATPTDPVSGTTYTAGASLGSGRVIAAGSATSFSASGLFPGVTYDVYVYSYNSGSCATVYNTVSPLTGSVTTSNVGATLLISPYGDGGFENGTTLASNGWTVVNAAVNAWTVGTVPTGFTNRSAYISNNGGAAWAYTNTSATASHIYKDITFPAGQSDITLSFNWKALGETSSWDALIVYTCPTSVIPLTTSPTGTGNTATWNGGSPTAIGSQLWNQGTNLQTFTGCLPASFAGTTQRIVITWKNDGSLGTSPPGAVDNISLVSATPAAPADQATNLVLTPISTSQINGSFTAATSAPTGYIVVRYPTGATPTDPVTGTTYVAGNSLGAGTVVSVGNSLTFNSTGLSGGTTYDYYVYDYSNSICAGITYNVVNPLMASMATNPCGSMSSPITVGPTGTYPTLSGAGGAIAAIAASGISAPMVIELQSTYTAAGETYPITINYNACVTASNTLTIRPEAATASPLVISSNNTTATIDLNGATNVIIDGRPGGTGTNKYLSIVNTSSTAASAGNAVLLRNDARNNTLTYLDLKASNLNPASNAGTVTNGAIPGVVAIHTTTGGITGNDNNVISFNDIHSATSTGNMLNVGIYAYNNTTVGSPTNNDNNTITDNNIYDIFHATTATAGIDILVGNNTWTITNNSYYKSPAVTYAYTAAVTQRAFWVTPNASAVASSGFTIQNNFIGGTAPQCGGSAYTYTSTAANAFNGMDISVGTAAVTSVQNNLITNFNATSAATASTAWVGINIAAGNVDIGTVTGNLIGSTANTGSIVYTATANTGGVIGIRTGGGSIVNVANNTVSGIDLYGSTLSVTPVFNGINCGGGTTVNITNNTVGSASMVNSINAVSATTGTSVQTIRGIIVNGGTTSTVTGNLVANLNSNIVSTGTTAHTVVGIAVTSTTSTVANNTIRNLSSSSQSTSGGSAPSVIGISYTATTAPAVIRGNTIHTLKNTNATTTSGPVVSGLYYGGASGTANLIEKNTIHSLVLTSTTVSAAAAITGMDIATGQVTIRNNMIRLGYDENGNSITTATLIRGISKNTNIANVYFNSIFIGGSGVLSTVAANTFAFTRTAAATTDDIRNNIFVNNRSNATTGGKHYQINLNSTATLTLNYNDYYGNGTGSVFGYNGTADVAAYTPGWVTGDINSQVGDPQFINPTGNATTGDLHINPAIQTVIEQQGQNIVSVTEDIDNQLRVSNTPEDMGADAGNFTPVNPCTGMPATGVAAFTNTLAVCGTGTKTMNLSGVTSQPGLTYQWQESLTGLPGSFVNVSTGTGGTTVSYTTGTLSASSPLYFQCIAKCTATGDSSISNTIQAIVNAAPTLVVTPATGTTVCSGSNVDLTASGAVTYTWTCNPGVAGYPIVSLLSTPNNLATVTARPTSTLASSTATPPATVATPTWIYTVTGADASGCTSTASVTLNVTTSALVPLTLTYTSSPDPLCDPGVPVTLTVNNNGTIGAGSWVYNWYDSTGNTLLQTATNTATSDVYTTPAPASAGNYAYTVKVSNTVCPSSYAVASPTFFVGYSSLKVVTNANCGDNGQIAVYPEGQTDFTDWYVNNFNSGLLGPAFDASYGNTNFTGGLCNITPQANSQTGTLLIRNPANVNTNNLQVDFLLSTSPRGFAFNILGADGLAWSYAADVFQGSGAGPGFQAESGSGTGFKLAFDATANGAQNTPGVYLMYNCTVPDQGPSSPGVIAFKQGSFWQGLVNAPVSIRITDNGFVTVYINNALVFDHVPLPTAYLTANKSTWLHAFTARTGGSNELHAIDNLSIRYNGYEYSHNSTNGFDGAWQGSNVFTGLAPGTYPIWVRKLSDPTCFTNTGNAVVGVSPSPSAAVTIPATGSSNVVCYGNSTTLTTDVFVPGATFLWESAPALAGPWSPATGLNNAGDYTTVGLTQNTYFRLTFTCPSSTPVTSTPLLVTVNAGSIASTNSPVLVNCIGDVATLTAVPGANTTCAWYEVPTGGSLLASGNTFTVSPTSLPKTYYVEPVTTIYSNHYYNGGVSVIANTLGTAGSGANISTRFNTTASIIIDSIKVIPSATGTLTVALQAAGSATNISSFNFTVTTAMVGNFVNVPVNLTVPGSGSYQLTTSGVSCTYYTSFTGSYAAAYMFLGGVFSVVGSATTPTGANSTAVYGTAFRISISTSCPAGSGARVPVQVQANPANAISITPASASLCVNSIQALVASSAAPYSSYTWTPATDLYTDPGGNFAYVAGTNTATVYCKPSSAGTPSYVVSTAGSGCTNTATVPVTVFPAPNVIATASPAIVCPTGNVQLNVNIPSSVYTMASIPFAPEPVPVTTSSISGDEAIQTVSLGFNFGYFGNTYTDVILHTNGYIQLGGSTPTCLSCYTPQTAPNAANPNNWAGIWADMSVGAGQVTYGTTGVAPNRKFIVNYNNVNFYSATPASTHQIILNEADNSVEIHLTSNVTTSTNSRAMGIENATGTVAYIPANRNAGTWTATNESWKFTPVVGNYTYDWSANPTYLSATNIVNPLAVGLSTNQTYTVLVSDATTGCSNTGTILVQANQPTTSSTTATNCYAYVWNGVTYTASGNYTYTTLNAAGCDSTAALDLTINTGSTSTTTVSACTAPYTWNGNTYTSSGVYTFSTLNAVGCDSVATLDLTIAPCNTTLNLTAFIEGYWDGTSAMNATLLNQGQANPSTDCDSILVEIHEAAAPLNVVASATAVLHTNGTATCIFPTAIATGYYYIVLKGRNSIETWSGDSILVSGSSITYNFSTAASQAYGSNQVELTTGGIPNGIFALYSGDIVKDAGESTDLLDLNQLEFEINNFSFGYFAEDLNGDGNVDILDSPVLETNISGFIFSSHP